ncbi:MAG: SAM-dependent methyltransferase, partial [Clostridia bacterium]
DTTRLQDLVRAQSAHLIVGDLPYGVQHAAKGEGGMSSLLKLSQAMLPACEKALKHGGAIALSFNTNTLRKEDLARLMREAGIEVLNRPPYHDFSHWVEQAVERDVLIGIKE